MFFIIKTIILSIILIVLFHYLWNYIKENYSTKKTRDLVGSQTQKYKNIIDEILRNKNIMKDDIEINEKDKKDLIYDAEAFMETLLSSTPEFSDSASSTKLYK